MNKLIILGTAVAFSLPAGAASIVDGGNLTVLSSYPATTSTTPYKSSTHLQSGVRVTPQPKAVNANAFYSNITTFLGQGYKNAGTAAVGGVLTTSMVCDDITYAAIETARTITVVRFSVGNFNATTLTARPFLRFFDSDGTGGDPGTFLGGANFNPVSITGGAVGTVTGTLGTAIALPGRGAAVTIWACQAYDGGGTSTANTAALLDNLAVGIFDPPDVGSSQDLFWQSNVADTFTSSNPAGSDFNLGANAVANFGWELNQATPYPVELQSFSVE